MIFVPSFLLVFLLSLSSVVRGADVCVDVGEGEFTCTDDVLGTRFKVDGRTIDVGVTQRIDGSESEKQAIKDVLKKMDEYFFKEVLAMPEYEFVRPRW